MATIWRKGSRSIGLTRPAVALREQHWLYQDIAFCFLPWGGGFLDLVSGVRYGAASGSYAQKMSAYGAECVTHSGVRTDTSAQFITANSFAVLTVGSVTSTTRGAMLVQRTGSGTNDIEIRCNAEGTGGAQSNNQLAFLVYDGGTLGYAHTAADATISKCPDSDALHWFAGRLSASGTPTVWVDGVDQTSGALDNASFANGGGSLTLGGLPGTTTIAFTGDAAFHIGWNRAPDDTEMAELRADSPEFWAMFYRPRPRTIFIPAAAVGGATFKPPSGLSLLGVGV